DSFWLQSQLFALSLLQCDERCICSDGYYIFGGGFESFRSCFYSHDFPARVGTWGDGGDLSVVSLVSSVDDESEGSDLEGNILDYFLCREAQLYGASDSEFLTAGSRVLRRGE